MENVETAQIHKQRVSKTSKHKTASHQKPNSAAENIGA